ncbi:M20/M25/M40 family metallo-hydrolase [Flavihumibacter fluvii]|uniref:M20/M25/M40 family metallo-hydrolase n=1 Tax=Flavihumibacter fluvii TaxID=2838157 RepID=UPI001BDF7126|nr:M20/M25/M40 family metallo-hydrolase [Flavihumibacter fluvii]ULQ51133.1 M20/M25/M40 family metallo-hydrolase [Flavihumibacter fluvii]
MSRIWFLLFYSCLPVSLLNAQDSVLMRIEQVEKLALDILASDSMNGRSAYSIENRKVADFIAGYFAATGLKPFQDSGFLQPFYGRSTDSASVLYNVVGFLPGRSRPLEYVIVSAHMDHLPPLESNKKDRIFNGANDNASGVAVLMALAQYYAALGNNERSLVFCAFNAEELGLWGSAYFAGKSDIKKIVAGINFDMMGVPQFGKNRLMITGRRYSTFYEIVKKNISGQGIKLKTDSQIDLFSRSDNYSFAQLGVPAHTFSTSDDRYPCYHKPCDELKKLDIPNMARLTKVIIQGISTIVNGTDSPVRINGK